MGNGASLHLKKLFSTLVVYIILRSFNMQVKANSLTLTLASYWVIYCIYVMHVSTHTLYSSYTYAYAHMHMHAQKERSPGGTQYIAHAVGS